MSVCNMASITLVSCQRTLSKINKVGLVRLNLAKDGIFCYERLFLEIAKITPRD